jgi:hypothetical protein
MRWLRSAPLCVEPYGRRQSASKMGSSTSFSAAWIFAAARAAQGTAKLAVMLRNAMPSSQVPTVVDDDELRALPRLRST